MNFSSAPTWPARSRHWARAGSGPLTASTMTSWPRASCSAASAPTTRYAAWCVGADGLPPARHIAASAWSTPSTAHFSARPRSTAIVLFPDPGRPATTINIPEACHTGLIILTARQCPLIVAGMDVAGCLGCDLAAGRQHSPGGILYETPSWLVNHVVGAMNLGTLIVAPREHIVAVADLDG